MSTRIVQRVVLPQNPDADILPLYVEGDLGPQPQDPRTQEEIDAGKELLVGAPAEHLSPALVIDRRSMTIDPRTRASFGTYFNAFPASYWRKWTLVDAVTLSATVSGTGELFVYRSNARGAIYRVDDAYFDGAERQTLTFTLPLDTFGDGGWYWFDVVAGRDGAALDEAHWETDDHDRPRGTVSVGITTLNRADDVVALLAQLGSEPELLEILDRVHVVDQGTQHPDDVEGFAEAEKALGGRLHLIRQANLGGSGGFSRGMSETLDEGVSTYHLISDDDLRTEPEGILRAVAFADLARRPTIVGGHMFSMYDRPYLHSMGERINPWRFWWASVIDNEGEGHHLNRDSLRGTQILHRRIDVDYNGWWMELVPVSVIREIGLSLPLFIKWDDAEYGLRAREHGVPTVSLPGVAAWHVPWTDKDDSIDWQAYYHLRNRLVAGLLHSPFERGGRLVRESFYHQVRHLLTSQYSVVELRSQAIEDLLSGPAHLHADLDTRLGKIRATRAQYDDARVAKDPDAFPPPAGLPGGVLVKNPRVRGLASAAKFTLSAGKGMLRQFRPVADGAAEHPQAYVPAERAGWATLIQFDSAVVSLRDGTGAAWYKRQPVEFRRQLRRSISLHQRLQREWPELAKQYKDAMGDLVGQDAWKATFARTEADRT
ncbi:glycosyltransferase-like protein [Xylanimonas cellulosilytica DSM 15894]|uniref:Glycosyltransferase-like protein n=1 Tax=Xylanimonas cellulosilytica (strain DSM 15894 / JCM 12276 / CECT 5975 / KCTC 9989 / LMG 20990 / NBRC 107835 / XIL07) TaxID=446471 RepID=D1BX21_XYLCX|nr:glycosyltransferase [Xylanimonas cellulosilytica]ACZ31589.1 glycosyltransferase-like protein [Xylanimonas cellulosilytica DSM 15894]